VTGKRDADGAGLVGNGEIGVARDAVVDLQKIDAGLGEGMDGEARLIRVGNGVGSGRRFNHQGSIKKSGGVDPRHVGAHAPFANRLHRNAGEHFADASDAV
jgi:hypothetical protein